VSFNIIYYVIGKEPTPQMARRGRRRMPYQSSRGRREPPPFELIDDNPTRNNTRIPNESHNVIEIVDLTNNTSR